LADKGTKGNRAREVPIIAEVRDIVLGQIESAKGRPDARLFVGPRGGRITTAVLRDATHWDEVVTALGYEHLRRHDLRHTGQTWMADAGVPVHVLRRIAGHGSLKTTQRYLHSDSHGYPTDLVLPAGGGAQAVHTAHNADAVVTEGVREYTYPLDQRAAMLCYHDHRMDFTGPSVYRGLAGLHIVRDDEEDALPQPRGEREVPLVLTDRAFAADGSFRYPSIDPSLTRTPGEKYDAGVALAAGCEVAVGAGVDESSESSESVGSGATDAMGVWTATEETVNLGRLNRVA